MAATVDFNHDEEVADAILDRLRNATNGLPSTWLDEDNPLLGLKRIDFGSLETYRFSGETGDEGLADLVPSILVRFTSSQEASAFGLIGGKEGQSATFSVVHVFGEEQCRDKTDASEPIQPERAKAQKAKIVNKAIFNDATNAYRRKLGNPTLTTSDTAAHIVIAVPAGVNYNPPEDGGALYAFAVQISVMTLTK